MRDWRRLVETMPEGAPLIDNQLSGKAPSRLPDSMMRVGIAIGAGVGPSGMPDTQAKEGSQDVAAPLLFGWSRW